MIMEEHGLKSDPSFEFCDGGVKVLYREGAVRGLPDNLAVVSYWISHDELASILNSDKCIAPAPSCKCEAIEFLIGKMEDIKGMLQELSHSIENIQDVLAREMMEGEPGHSIDVMKTVLQGHSPNIKGRILIQTRIDKNDKNEDRQKES